MAECTLTPEPVTPAVGVEGVLTAARAQLDNAAEAIEQYAHSFGISTAEEVARLVSARVELSAAYERHVYAVNAARLGHPF